MVSGTLTGHREQSITPLITNVRDAGIVFSNWLPFVHGNNTSATIVVIVIIAGLAILCITQLLKDRRIFRYESIAAAYALFYILFMTPEVIAYNSNAVSAADAPKDWADVVDPKWKGKVLIRNPVESGTMRAIFGAMRLAFSITISATCTCQQKRERP